MGLNFFLLLFLKKIVIPGSNTKTSPNSGAKLAVEFSPTFTARFCFTPTFVALNCNNIDENEPTVII